MTLFWILLLSVPFLISFFGALIIFLGLILKGPEAGMVVALVLFSCIAAYLYRLLVKSVEPDGGIVSISYSGTDKVNLSWGGKEPGFFTYVTYLLLGPGAFLLFNKGRFPNFPQPGPQPNIATRKMMTVLILGITYLLLISGALMLFGHENIGIWIFAGLIGIPPLIVWLATVIGMLAKMLQERRPG
jgi:hypothetical protein